MKNCPNCGFQNNSIETECSKCGIVFKKWEAFQAREQRTEKTETNFNSNNILDIWLFRKDFEDLKYSQPTVNTNPVSIYGRSFGVIIPLIGFVGFVFLGVVTASSFIENPLLSILLVVVSVTFSVVISMIIFYICLTKTREEIAENKVKQQKNHKKLKRDALSKKIAEWGYEINSVEHKALSPIFYSLLYLVGEIHFRFISIHDMENRRAFELRYGNTEAHAIDHEVFNHHVVDEIKRIAEACNQIQNGLDCNGFEELRYKGEHPFPSVFIFTHKCKFLTIYGEEIAGVDAMASILFEEIVKIKPAFNVDLLHHVARIEISESGVDMENLDYETLAQPGIVKGQNRRRGNISLELRDTLLREANYACIECGARATDGATLEVDHIVPFSRGGSDECENLQILCATCNRKKGSKL
jgi:hypothetical protein